MTRLLPTHRSSATASARASSGATSPWARVCTYGRATAEVIAETLWPTRCAVCDEPGEVLCASCRANLPYLDWWRACPRCGAPFGHVQCSECNPVTLAGIGRDTLAFEGCVSTVTFNNAAARIVRTWKDAGERRLVHEMAHLMARVIPPLWQAEHPAMVPIPASRAAVRKRGFDHGSDLTEALAGISGLTILPLLAQPRTHDQRSLTRHERMRNMQGRFTVLPGASVPFSVVVVDDVFTTGATLSAAADALRAAGAHTVRCLTFARVW